MQVRLLGRVALNAAGEDVAGAGQQSLLPLHDLSGMYLKVSGQLVERAIPFEGLYGHFRLECRLFSQIVGLSPINYLTRRRLEMATSLLRRTPLPVGEVGAAVGWLDANYFSRRFHDNFGISPSNYRARFMSVQQGSGDERADVSFAAHRDSARLS